MSAPDSTELRRPGEPTNCPTCGAELGPDDYWNAHNATGPEGIRPRPPGAVIDWRCGECWGLGRIDAEDLP